MTDYYDCIQSEPWEVCIPGTTTLGLSSLHTYLSCGDESTDKRYCDYQTSKKSKVDLQTKSFIMCKPISLPHLSRSYKEGDAYGIYMG